MNQIRLAFHGAATLFGLAFAIPAIGAGNFVLGIIIGTVCAVAFNTAVLVLTGGIWK